MDKIYYSCPKCGGTQYESGQFHAAGSDLARLFDVQNKKFTTVSCTRCGYTELYRSNSSSGMNILDFLIGG